jgi:alpha-amylase
MTHPPRLGPLLALVLVALAAPRAGAQEQPLAIYHAFDQTFADVESFVCELAKQGYSHVQITPAQKSNPDGQWWARYQPVDYAKIEGRGSKDQLAALIRKAHGCHVKVIADVVFNHMANMEAFRSLDFPGISHENFHRECPIFYDDGNRDSEVNCWLGLPDLDQSKPAVVRAHRGHLKTLMALGIDGFRFDAAKHMSTQVMQDYVAFINQESRGKTWNYLEVIEDKDTDAGVYSGIAAVTDFRLYRAMKKAFSPGGSLRELRVANAFNDGRSVTFGQNHDTIRALNPRYALDPYDDPADSYLATAFVLAREEGTPLVFNDDNLKAPYIHHGVRFRQIMGQRKQQGASVKQNVLAVVDKDTVLVMERGPEGFVVINKGKDRFDVPVLDMTLSNLEGCYRELRNDFTVAIEKRDGNKKFVTRWGTAARGGMEVYGRDALYFVREPFERCR